MMDIVGNKYPEFLFHISNTDIPIQYSYWQWYCLNKSVTN